MLSNCEPFEPTTTTQKDWKDQAKKGFGNALTEHVAEQTSGGESAPLKRNLQHFNWLARYRCGDNEDGTYGWTYAKLTQYLFKDIPAPPAHTTVANRIQELQKLLGLPQMKPGRRSSANPTL